jgi:PilZ domain
MYDASSDADSNAGFPHKRAIRRFALQLPVTITAKSGEKMRVTAESRDVSSHGICFFCDSAMEPESAIEFTLTLPSEVTMSEPLAVRCSGKVVRVERQPQNRFAVAAAITNYEFLSDCGEEVATVADRPQAM